MGKCLIDISGTGIHYSPITPTDIQPLAMIDLLYPIGSVVLRSDSVDPSTLYTGTTWELIGTKLAVRENVFGNGKSLGVTDGESFNGLAFKTSWALWRGTNFYNKTLPFSSASAGDYIANDRAFGIPTKAQLGNNPGNSGLIVDTETIYSWRRTA